VIGRFSFSNRILRPIKGLRYPRQPSCIIRASTYQGYYARDQRLASGPHPGEPTPQEVREQGTKFCVGTPADCIRFLEMYEALGIEEVFLLCAIGPAQHQEVLHTIRLFGEQVIPHFQARKPCVQVAQASA
jgi:alkanesulfonate monooxygenase SsuD/methylene tetrahydromethanopterin reductase-like flavin-dependent oxidoreductase (luciferase family)